MSGGALDRVARLFEELVPLGTAERAARLASAGLSPGERTHLERLLAADATPDDPLARAIDGVALQAGNSIQAGNRLGPWRVIRELGSGGMGTVFLAERDDAQFVQRVAIKLMRGFPTQDGMRRLRQERQILATLDHPNIAHLLDGGETDEGQPYVVMELVEGRELLAYAAAAGLDRAARLALFDKIATAVQHAHQRLVIHRDIKPGNVMVRDDGEPKLLDFGVAKLVDVGDSGARNTSTRVFTAGYTSPEQESGNTVTTASDVFSLGVLLGELLKQDPVRADPELDAIVAMATRPESGERYATVEALREELRRKQEGRPVRARRGNTAYRARKFLLRHRVGAFAALLLLAGVGAFVWRLDAERDRALAAERRAQDDRAKAQAAAQNAETTLGFFGGLIAEAGPEATGGRAFTVRELIERGEARIGRELPADSPQRALVAFFFGTLQAALGEYARAEPLLRAGIETHRRAGGGDSLILADMISAHGGVLRALERAEEGNALLLAAAQMRERVAPDTPTALYQALVDRAVAGYEQDLDAALADFDRAQRLVPDYPEVGQREWLNGRQFHAALLNTASRHEEAIALAQDTLDRMGRAGLENSVQRVDLLRRKAQGLRALGRGSDALPVLDEARGLAFAAFGTVNPTVIDIDNERGIALNEIGRFAEARAVFEQLRADARMAREGMDAEDAVVLGNLASVYENAGDYAGAIAMFDQVIALVSKGDQVERQSMLQRARSNRARSLALAGRLAEAWPEINALLQAARETSAEQPFEHGFEALRASQIARWYARWPEAAALAAEARPLLATVLPPEHDVFSAMLRHDGHVAMAQGRFDEADAAFAQARQRLLANYGDDSFDGYVTAVDLARLRHAQGRDDEARALLEPARAGLAPLVLPGEINRAAAERLAAELGMPRTE